MESYKQMKSRHQAEINALPIGFAFGKKQTEEMMQKFGLPNDETGYAQIVSLGYGCYMKRTDYPKYKEAYERHDREMRELVLNNPDEFKKALIYEFGNHEAQYNRDDAVILACFALTVKEVNETPELQKIYNDAYGVFWQRCVENGWF